MRIFSLIFIFCLLMSCQEKSNKKLMPKFLIGNWKRLDDKPNNQTFENWNADFTGMGYTLKDGKTTFSEVLSIVSINDTLHLKVSGVNKVPTFFKFTNQTDTSFVCENPNNEFPKKITYFKDGKLLKAIVAADDFRIDFTFEPISKMLH